MWCRANPIPQRKTQPQCIAMLSGHLSSHHLLFPLKSSLTVSACSFSPSLLRSNFPKKMHSASQTMGFARRVCLFFCISPLSISYLGQLFRVQTKSLSPNPPPKNSTSRENKTRRAWLFRCFCFSLALSRIFVICLWRSRSVYSFFLIGDFLCFSNIGN